MIASASPSDGGFVIGTGMYDIGSICTLTATANEGYAYMYWTEDDEVVSTQAEYSFCVRKDRELMAHFGTPFHIGVTIVPEGGGTVSGEGEYTYGSTCTLTATANEGYDFICWRKSNGNVVTTALTCSFTVTEATTLTAVFAASGGEQIPFADLNVKDLCVANWDTNGDGELSYSEAAAVTDLGQVFYYKSTITSFEELQYFTGLTTIGDDAFMGCRNLSGSLYIPNSVTTIGSWAFYDCIGFTGSLTIPNSVTTIGDAAFENCSGFTGNLTIGNSVTMIGNSAFNNCSGFTGSLTIPNSVVSIGNFAFCDCSGFTGSLTIGNSVTTIGMNAFYNCSGFSGSLTIPNSVTEIGAQAFTNCIGFTGSLTIGNSVTTIGGYAFENCSSFTGDLNIPNSVTEIDNYAFYNCSGFTGNLTIGNSVTTIGYNAFYHCGNLSSLTILAEIPPTLNSQAFAGVNTGIPVYVPCESVEVYMTANWGGFNGFYGMCGGTVAVSANPEEGGTVAGGGVFEAGESCMVTATANEGYSFAYWAENGEQVSSEANYSFVVVSNRDLVAHFSLPLTVSVTTNMVGGGTVTGGGIFNYGTTCTLTATPNTGYVFNNWTKNGEMVSCLSICQIPVTETAEYVANFQQVDGIVVGDAVSSSYYLPTYSYYSLTEQIYTANEMGGEATEISSVSFYNTSTSSRIRDMSIYMVNTNKTSFGNNTDWIPVTDANLVFDGNVTIAARSWVTIYFSMPFAYDGVSNVALIVDDNSNNYNAYISCRTFSAEGNQTLRLYGSGTDYDPHAPNSYTGMLMSQKNQVIFGVASYDYTVTVSANPSNGGTVSGGGSYYYGYPITLTAIPNEGYMFNYWTKNGEVVSCLSTYQISVSETVEYVANFQQMDGIVIGDAVSSSYYLPIYHHNSLSEQIYTASEMGGQACEISSVSFFNTGTSSRTRTMSVYMVSTDKTVFDGVSDWIPVTESNLVFSGSVVIPAHDWATVYFSMPFNYDGSSNVALIVDDNTNSYNSSTSCRTFVTEGNQAIRISGSGTNYDPTNPSSYTGTLMSMKNQVVFGFPSYDYTITATANPTNGGTVSGGGPCYLNQPITLKATASEGYIFSNWTKNGELVSYLSHYNLTVTESAEYVANFEVAPEGIVIGDGTYTKSYLPSNAVYNYTLSQQIYTADEMGGEACEISSVSFFNTGTAKTRNYTIYMINAEKAAFENTTDWITVTEADQVFSGSFTMAAYGWTTIYFNTPFSYDGTSNLALIVDDNTGSWSSGMTCRVYPTDVNQAIYIYSDGTNYDPYNSSGYNGTLPLEKNQVIFGIPSYDYTVTVAVGPDGGGTVSGGGLCFQNQPITLIATPNEGYVFSRWTKNGEVVSYLSSYILSVTESAEYVAHFQEVISGFVIGNATYSNTYLPIYYYNSLSEQIYTAAEMGGSATNIYSVSFFNTGTYGVTRNMSVYMVNTDKTSFESTTDWIPVTENDLVFSGSVVMTARGWATVYFSTPFVYDGVSNVALVVDDNSNSYNAYTSCRTFSTEENQAIRIYGYNTDYDPTNPSSYTGTLMSMKNQVIFRWPSTVTATANPTGGGTVSGCGNYAYGTTCTLTATPNAGYYFLNWTENGSVVSYDAAYSFTVEGNRNLVANFIEGESNCTIVFDLYSSWGSGWYGNYLVVDYGNGNTEQLTLSNGSTISYSREVATGSTIALSWIAGSYTYQCSFDVKFENGVPIYHGSSLSSSFQQELNINCAVATAPRVITAVAEPEEGGTIEGAGTYDGGTAITLTATPNPGYVFNNWTKNGSIVSCLSSFTITVTESAEFVANFLLIGDGVLIGEGLMSNKYLPSYSRHGYTLSQQIFTADEIGRNACEINSVAFFNVLQSYPRDFMIYMVSTDKTSFENDSDWITVTESDLVFNGTVTLNQNSWTTIYFNSPFMYDGMSNLALIIDDNTSSYWYAPDGIKCRTFSTDMNQTLCINADITNDHNINYDPYYPSAYIGLLMSEKNQVIFGVTLTTVQQTIALSQGWNWFSSNVEITLDDLQNALVDALLGTKITIKSKNNGQTIYNGTTWSGPLTTLDVAQMYRISVSGDCEITLEGTLLNPAEHPVTINNGVNRIGFPLSESVSLSNTFNGFAVSGDVVKSKSNGIATYNGSQWGERSTPLSQDRGIFTSLLQRGQRL